MTSEKKDQTVDDIVNDIVKYHGKDFEERMKKLEEFHHPDKQHDLMFQQHAEYIVKGKPSDDKGFPGAYRVAYSKLDSVLKGRLDKFGDKDDEMIKSVLESYVDTFLQSALSPKQKDALKNLKGDKEQILKMKGKLFAIYHKTDRGTIDPFSEDFIRQFKGKTKQESIELLKALAESSIKGYTSYLNTKIYRSLTDEHDLLHLPDYVVPKMEKAGLKHPDHPLTRDHNELINDYITFIKGGDMQKRGYKKEPVA